MIRIAKMVLEVLLIVFPVVEIVNVLTGKELNTQVILGALTVTIIYFVRELIKDIKESL